MTTYTPTTPPVRQSDSWSHAASAPYGLRYPQASFVHRISCIRLGGSQEQMPVTWISNVIHDIYPLVVISYAGWGVTGMADEKTPSTRASSQFPSQAMCIDRRTATGRERTAKLPIALSVSVARPQPVCIRLGDRCPKALGQARHGCRAFVSVVATALAELVTANGEFRWDSQERSPTVTTDTRHPSALRHVGTVQRAIARRCGALPNGPRGALEYGTALGTRKYHRRIVYGTVGVHQEASLAGAAAPAVCSSAGLFACRIIPERTS